MKIFLFSMLVLSHMPLNSHSTWKMDNKKSTVIDMSKICVNNLEENVYLPYGMGTADALVLIIANTFNLRRCSIIFHKEILRDNLYKIVVLEFLNDVNISGVCKDGDLYVIENYVNSVNLCNLFNVSYFQNPFVFTTQFDLRLNIVDLRKTKFNGLKLTVTSTRKLKVDENCNQNEISCDFNSTGPCISTELQCDGNINCGQLRLSDEDTNICTRKRSKSLFFVVSLSLIIIVFLIYSSAYRIRKWSPKIKRRLKIRNPNEENTIVLSNYAPAVKTYISKREVRTLHLRVASTTDSSSSKTTTNDEAFLQAGFYKLKGEQSSPTPCRKNR